MSRARVTVCRWVWTAWALSAAPVWAVYEEQADADMNVNAKVYAETQAPSPERAIQEAAARREAAEKRECRLRTLGPVHVREWVEGRLAEEALDTVAASATAGAEPVGGGMTPGAGRRLSLAGLASAVLLALLLRQRVRERRRAPSPSRAGR